VLDFKLSDRTRIMDFIRCNRDHHNLSFAKGSAATLNHIAFHMPSLESVMKGAGRLRDAGYPIEWGVGRHGPGNNVFAYFVAPGDVVVEYTAEVEQVDDSYKTGYPDDWTWPPGRIDHWGISPPPSPRLKEAQAKIGFRTT
jgi:Glyoxalase/Bleomycin resistance protein/Dioxygenase superfamily